MPAPIPEERIFDATIDTIIDHGYAGATMGQIAEAAGIGEATLFRRFTNKETLLREAMKFEAVKFTQEGVRYTGHLEADLERVIRSYNRLLRNRGRIFFVMLNELPRRPELVEVAATTMGAVAEVTALLERYQQEGKLNGKAPWEATLALLGPVLVTSTFKNLNPLLPVSLDPKGHVERYLNGWK